MQRERKFRVWDPPANWMTYSCGDEFSEPYYISLNGKVMDDVKASCPNAILMEWTGLKDKNGTDIYEGDITQDLILTRKKVLTQVRWDNELASCSCCYSPFSGSGFIVSDRETDPYSLLVIGNIYQNPELLEKIK